MALKFRKRAVVEETDLYRRRSWDSRDGRFSVSEFTRHLEGNQRVFYAEVLCRLPDGRDVWDVISCHRTRRAAEKACEQLAKRKLVNS